MASEARGFRFVSSVASRSLLAGCLAFAFLEVLTGTHYYATAAALGGLALLTVWDASRLESALPAAEPDGSLHRRDHLQEMERATALLDAVTVALIATSDDGRIRFANQAARRLAGAVPGALADIKLLGADVAAEILALPNGARRIVTLTDARLVLVWTVGLAVPGEAAQKLVSLQVVAGELDAVQLRAWQDMTRVLAHEIMNSLTPIASLSESAAELMECGGAPPSAVSRAVDAISRRTRHLIDFVERYREIADLPEPRPRAIRAANLAADLEAVLEPDFAARGIAFACDIEPPKLEFLADPELLSQALLNLLQNAVEAVTGLGEPAVSLSCRQSGLEVVWSVADNGPGVPTERLQEIFVPFFTTKANGSGIGLTLARQIALTHGGRLESVGRDGGGAVFTLTLPYRSRGG